MKVINHYLISLTIATCLIDVIIAVARQNDLALYLTANIIVFLVVTLLHVYLNKRAKRSLNLIALVLFTGFIAIVLIKVVNVLVF